MKQINGGELPVTETQPAAPNLDNPYVGPRPFSIEERGRFFGRDIESNQLLSLVIAERLVLFYAQSGAGKSSLINARLIPGLEERNFQVLTGRVSGQTTAEDSFNVSTESGGSHPNIFTQNLLLSLEHSAGRDHVENAKKLSNLSLAEYFANLEVDAPTPSPSAERANGNEKLLIDAPQIYSGAHPLALIIDQFEEIFTTNPGAWRQRRPFFEQISEAMEQDPYLWVVLVIREDYVAALDPFTKLLPGRLRARFYMQRMRYDAAMEAVMRPVATLRPFEDDAAHELVQNLSLIYTGKDPDNQPVFTAGQYIEPVQLQVVCYQLWEALRNSPRPTITRQDLQSLTAGKNLATFISDALALFYVNALREVQGKHPEISERKLREFFSHELITESETRGAVVEGKERTGSPPTDIPNAVVHALQGRFVIRAEVRGENTWYELSHDRFVAPILQSNREWAEENSVPLEAAAGKWLEAGRDPARLYDGRQLNEAAALLTKTPDELSETVKEFVRASQEAARSKERRRQRIAFIVLSALLILAVVMAVIAGYNGVEAVKQRSTAESASTLAIQQQARAESESTRAIEQQLLAEAESTVAARERDRAEIERERAIEQEMLAKAESTRAIEQQRRAEAESTRAVEQEQIAKTAEAKAQEANVQSQASRLASLADFFQNTQPNLSTILAIRAVDVYDNWETRQSLLDSLQRGLATQIEKSNTIYMDDFSPNSITFSPDGRFLAAGLENGEVKLLGIDGQTANRSLPQERVFLAEVTSVAFNSSGDILAVAGDDRDVILWGIGQSANQDTYESFHVFSETGFYYGIRKVAFQPGGNFIAVATNQATQDPSNSGFILLFDLRDLQAGPKFSEACPQANCSALAWSQDGEKLAFGDSSGNLKVLRVQADGRPSIVWQKGKAHNDQIRGLVWYNDNQRLVSGGLDQQINQWDILARGTTPVLVSNRTITPSVFDLAISPSGRYLLAAGNENGKLVTVWDAETLQLRQYRGLENPHSLPVQAVAFSRQGTLFASASSDNFINIWSFNPIDPLGRDEWISNAPGLTKAVTADPEGNLFIARVTGSQVDVWKRVQSGTGPVTGEKILTISHPASGVALQSDNEIVSLLLGSADGKVDGFNVLDGASIFGSIEIAKGMELRAVTASLDSGQVAAAACTGGGRCNQILIVSTGSSDPARPIAFDGLSTELINALAFSPDGAVLAAATSEGRILLYDTQTLQLINQAVTESMRLGTVKLSVSALAFSDAETGLLAAGFFDGRVALWEAKTGYPIGVFDERGVGQVTGLSFQQDDSGDWTALSVSEGGIVRRWEIDRQAWVTRGCQKLINQSSDLNTRASALYPDTTVENLCR